VDKIDELLEIKDILMLEEYRAILDQVGQKRIAILAGRSVAVKVVGIDDDGVLLVSDMHGNIIRIPSVAMIGE
jgi:hypothetical protein